MRVILGAHLLDPIVSWIGIACVFFLDSAGAGQSFVDRRDLVSRHVGSSVSRDTFSVTTVLFSVQGSLAVVAGA
jgi:hypothetical protein